MAVVRDGSIILLVILGMLLATVPMLLLAAMVYGLGQLTRHRNLPSWLGLTSAYLGLALAYVELGMAALARPVLEVAAMQASLSSWRDALWRQIKGRRA